MGGGGNFPRGQFSGHRSSHTKKTTNTKNQSADCNVTGLWAADSTTIKWRIFQFLFVAKLLMLLHSYFDSERLGIF